MSALHEFQTSFGAYLTGDAAIEDCAGLSSDTVENAAIYQNNVRHAHSGALASTYPALRNLIGEDCFDAIADQFCEASPPASSVLSEYGEEFPAYLANCPELSGFPFLPEVARLEWAMNVALHSPLSPVTQASDLARLAEAESTDISDLLEPTTSLQLFMSEQPVQDILIAALANDAERISTIEHAPQRLAIFRRNEGVVVEPLTAAEFTFLTAIVLGQSFGKAADQAIAQEPAIAIENIIGRLLTLGVFAALPLTSKGLPS